MRVNRTPGIRNIARIIRAQKKERATDDEQTLPRYDPEPTSKKAGYRRFSKMGDESEVFPASRWKLANASEGARTILTLVRK